MLVKGTPNESLIYLGGSSLSETDGLGPAATVLQIGDYRICVDYGLEFLGDGKYGCPNHEALGGKRIDSVILTHCHTDHVGALALGEDENVFADNAEILASPQTHEITPIALWQTWQNTGKNFTSISKITDRQVDLPVGEFEIAPGIEAFASPAGHIPGALYLIIRTPGGLKVCFMGDHAWHDQEVVGPSSFPDDIPDQWLPDVLAQIDLTNSKLSSPNYGDQMEKLAEKVKDLLSQGKKVVIFTFMVGREQNVAMGLRNRGVSPIYCDGGGVEIFRIFHENRWSTIDKPIDTSDLLMIEGEKTTQQREEIFARNEPFVVVTPHGMGDGGPAIHWLKAGLEREDFYFIGVSWAAPGSNLVKLEEKVRVRDERGTDKFMVIRDNRSGETEEKPLRVIAGLSRFHLSGHGNLGDSINALRKIVERRGKKLQVICTTHGTQESKKLCESLLKDFADDIAMGNVGFQVPLG